jgi:IS1 family transposase
VHTKEAHLPGATIYSATYGDAWVWIAFAPVWRLVLAFVIGKRDQANADLLLARVAHVTDDHLPFFANDQLPQYKHALQQFPEDSQTQQPSRYPRWLFVNMNATIRLGLEPFNWLRVLLIGITS